MDAVVIQCSKKKHEEAGTFKTNQGKVVRFVAQPEKHTTKKGEVFFRPDDMHPDLNVTWREYLKIYNRQSENQFELLKAANLYARDIYQRLAEDKRWKTFILSAGWGLVRADFLLPSYDITFSKIAEEYERRRPEDEFDDFNHLSNKRLNTIYFFGGTEYLDLYYKQTRHIPGRKVVYYVSKSLKKEQGHGYNYIKYTTTQKTNWHYKCASDFIKGGVRK